MRGNVRRKTNNDMKFVTKLFGWGIFKPAVIFVLHTSSLEVDIVGKTYQLLNSTDHATFLRASNMNHAYYRTEIAHQALLMLLDSPLNKAGRLKGVYVRTQSGVLFEVKTHARLPRVYKKFAELICELFKFHVVAEYDIVKVQLAKNPVTEHLPKNARIIGLKHSLAKTCKDTETDIVFVLGEMTAYCIATICEGFSTAWRII